MKWGDKMNIVKEYREKMGLTQKELANNVGISVKTVQSIEQNIRKPSTKLMVKLIEVLKIPLKSIKIFLSQ